MATLMRRFDSICSTDGDKTAFYTTALLLDESVNTIQETVRLPRTVGFSELNENIKLIASELYHRHGLRPMQRSNLLPSDLNEKCKLNVLIASNQPSPGEAAAVMACTKLHVPFVPIALDGPHRTSDARVELILDEVKPTLAIVVLCLAEEKNLKVHNENDWETRPALNHPEIDVESHPSILRLNRLGIHRIVVVNGQDGTVIGAIAGLQAEISIPFSSIDEDGNDPMYILYTSGSTSKPKAVVQSYAGLWNRIQWQWDVFPYVQQMRRKYGMKETLKLLAQDGIVEEKESRDCDIDDIVFRRTSLSFVDSIVEIFGPLLAGVSLWCPLQLHGQDTTPYRGFGLHYFLDMAINDGIRITRMTCLPSQLGQALRIQKEDTRSDTKEWTRVLDFVIVSGEPCPSSLPALFEDCMSKKKSMLVNLYGQTESSGDVSCMIVSCDSQENEPVRFPNAIQYAWKRAKKQDPSVKIESKIRSSQNIQESIVPCGYPIRGHKFMIKPFDKKTDNMLSSLECGRLFVSGPGLALGYFNNESEMTDNFIVQEEKGKKEIWLNTMDIAFLDNESGSVIVIGRAPKALEHTGCQSAVAMCSSSIGKINGVMIHTSEMESAFNAALKRILVREGFASENYINESIGVLFSDKSNHSNTKSAIFCELNTIPQMIPSETILISQRVIDASSARFQNSNLTFQDIVVDARRVILSTCHPVLVPNYCFLVEEFPKNGAAGKVDRSVLVKFASDFVMKKSTALPKIKKDDEDGKLRSSMHNFRLRTSLTHQFDFI